MTPPAWYSQKFRPDGGITAEGLRNQLGRPALSVLTVLVRESAQNSWDAKQDDHVDFSLDFVTVSAAHRQAWVDLLAPGAPADSNFLRTLPDLLRSSEIRYLAVSDRGTSGLGGPTRSDVAAETNHRGWLSFVLNSGEKQDVDGGGGTYGYGKGAFFLASRVGTVLIYTRFRDDGGVRSRLIGSALLSSSSDGEVPYTGRHWWGLPHDGHCEPLIDVEADATARALGIPGFKGEETGTTVVVLDPDVADPAVPEDDTSRMSAEQVGRYVADAAAWNLWPLMLADRAPRLRVRVTAHGVRLTVPSETNDPVLADFADAYRLMSSAEGEGVMCLRPKVLLGRFGHRDTYGGLVDSPAAAELGLGGSPNHVCLMRRPDLVVQYLPGPEKAHPIAGYVGVFKVDDELDAVFARSEPPTHDAWVDAQLTGRDATFVRVARKRINERCAAIAGPKAREVTVTGMPVGSVAQRLGFLLGGVGNGGASEVEPSGAGLALPSGTPGFGGGQPGSATGSGVDSGGAPRHGAVKGTRQRRPMLLGGPSFVAFDGELVLAQRVRAFGPGPISGSVRVVTGEGGLEASGPAGVALPGVLGWRDGDVFIRGSVFEPDGTVDVELLVTPVVDTAVDIVAEVLKS
jgi:hypothetical protein